MKNIGIRTSFHKTTDKGTFQEKRAYNSGQLEKWFSHNHRDYQNEDLAAFTHSLIDRSLSKYNKNYFPNLNIINPSIVSYKNWFNDFFEEAKNEYNNKQKRSDRKINDVFLHYEKRKQNAIAEQIILSCGDETNIGKLKKLVYQTNNQNEINDFNQIFENWNKEIVNKLEQDLPDFKIYCSSLHLNETTPHLKIIGAPIIKDDKVKNSLTTRLSSRSVFTISTLKKEHQNLREFNNQLANQLTNFCEKYNFTFKNNSIQFHSIQENKINEIINIKNNYIKLLIKDIYSGNLSASDLDVIKDLIHFKNSENVELIKNNIDKLNNLLNEKIQQEEVYKTKIQNLDIENKKIANALNKTNQYITNNLLIKNTGFFKTKLEADPQKIKDFQAFQNQIKIDNHKFDETKNQEDNQKDKEEISNLNKFTWSLKHNFLDDNNIYLIKQNFYNNTIANLENREKDIKLAKANIENTKANHQAYIQQLKVKLEEQGDKLQESKNLNAYFFKKIKDTNNLKIQNYFLKNIDNVLPVEQKNNEDYQIIKNNLEEVKFQKENIKIKQEEPKEENKEEESYNIKS